MIVEFYKTEKGKKPAGDFIKSIEDVKLRAKVVRSLKLLETYGTELRETDSKPLGDGIFELRTIQGITSPDVCTSSLSGIKQLSQTALSKSSKKHHLKKPILQRNIKQITKGETSNERS